jgi:hypothetical protein
MCCVRLSNWPWVPSERFEPLVTVPSMARVSTPQASGNNDLQLTNAVQGPEPHHLGPVPLQTVTTKPSSVQAVALTLTPRVLVPSARGSRPYIYIYASHTYTCPHSHTYIHYRRQCPALEAAMPETWDQSESPGTSSALNVLLPYSYAGQLWFDSRQEKASFSTPRVKAGFEALPASHTLGTRGPF